MFDLGAQELVVIFVVALVVFGPRKLPELARNMGKGVGRLKKAMYDIKTQVDAEVEDVEGRSKPDIPVWKGPEEGAEGSPGEAAKDEGASASAPASGEQEKDGQG